jgi:hypothetical protein
MPSLPARIVLFLVLAASPGFAQNNPADVKPMKFDPRSGLIEVMPSEAMQNSPAAVELINRQMRKHAVLLQHPALAAQVLQNPETRKLEFVKKWQGEAHEKLLEAIRVRIVPDSSMIELSIDSAVAGDDAVTLTERIINQHLENQKLIAQNQQLERSVMLNNLKQRYQFRKDELGRDLREKAVQLSIDGMGMPGRLSAKEVELQNLLNLRFELERKKLDAAVGDKAAVDAQIKLVDERLDATKKDLGDLTNSMNRYLTLKEDEEKTRELLAKINEQLEQISQGANADQSGVRWLCQPIK